MPPRAAIDAALRPTRAEIDLAAIRHNVTVLRAMLHEAAAERGERPSALWGVVKADGYGHGAVAVGRAMVRAGAAGLCVALVEEGLELRAAGVTVPVLVMSGVYRDGLAEALHAGLVPVIYDPTQLDDLARWAADAQGPARVHVKVDTGMARLGITARELAAVSARLAAMPQVDVDGLMTHFACADEDDPSFTQTQLARFEEARAVVARAGLDPRVFHAANSAGALRFAGARYSFVRPGIALYGIAPFAHSGPALLPAFRLRTEVLALRELAAGTPVGYAGAWVTARRSVIATVPIGYADGFFRRLSSEAEVLVRGRRARVVGNVSMDMAMIDVTHLALGASAPGVAVGDEVVLLGTQQSPGAFESIRAEEVAARVGTIPYEVLTAVSRRVPRAYLREASEGAPASERAR